MKGMEKRPHPGVPLYTFKSAAMLFGVSPRTVANKVSAHAEAMAAPPMYRRGLGGRLERLLTEGDVVILRSLFPVYVKQKAPSR